MLFRPCVAFRGYQAIRFNGRLGLEGVFSGKVVVTGLASPTGARDTYEPGPGEAYELPLGGTVRKAA